MRIPPNDETVRSNRASPYFSEEEERLAERIKPDEPYLCVDAFCLNGLADECAEAVLTRIEGERAIVKEHVKAAILQVLIETALEP